MMMISNPFIQLRDINRELWRLNMHRSELEACLMPQGIRYDVDRVQSSPTDKMSTFVSVIADIDTKIKKLSMKKAALITDIENGLQQLQSSTDRTLITAYYIKRMPMDEISALLGYNRQHCYKLLSVGVKRLERSMRESCDKCDKHM